MSASSVLPAVTDADFAERVLAAPGLVLVDVWAAWCTPCLTLSPVLERLADAYRGKAQVVTLDADANVETVVKYDVRSLPSVLAFRNGALVSRQSGAQSYGTYTATVDRLLGEAALPGGTTTAPTVPVWQEAWQVPVDEHDPALAEARALTAAAEPTVLFKHSVTCSISVSVKREYDAFVAANPDVPTRMVIVQTERPLSNALAKVLQVQHESPQAIVVHNGEVLWHGSHRRVTAANLTSAVKG
ncbi:MAG TPA: bacillithiol system redox-active protein YtxJ [Gemmatimonas sp.]|uniref:bacillithiol system redox-active protein YtxJ n=1 Tax=Gemmatimonas sp. TaxID=1962908 RepID=UPI002ED8B62D